MTFPDFNENGDLPVGIYSATLQEVLEHFGKGSLQRRLVAGRLTKIYRLAKSTNQLLRFIIYGSFVTGKPNPNDVDIFLVMDDNFDKSHFQSNVRSIFEHLESNNDFGASIFWSRRKFIIGGEQLFVEDWQIKRDKTRRGIVEVTEND
jgi:predicted nucleotidyltransferase